MSSKAKPPPNRARRSSRRAKLPPIETYSDERIAQFLLNNAIDADDYAVACDDVRKLGLDPVRIKHVKPPGVK